MKIDWLLQHCRLNDSKEVAKLLKTTVVNIDLTHSEGIYFRFAIKHDNADILNSLLEYYRNTTGLQLEPSTIEYQKALFELKKILIEAEHSYDFSSVIQKILAQYIEVSGDAESEDEQDLSECEEIDFSYNTIIHQSFSQAECIKDQQAASQLLLHSSSESLLSTLDSSCSTEIHETSNHEAGNLGQEAELFADS